MGKFGGVVNADRLGLSHRDCRITPPPYGTGTRVRRHGAFIGRSFEWVIEVTEFEPGRLVRMKYVSGPFAGGVDYSILPVGEGSEVVIRNYGNANFWFPFMAAMMRASVQAGRLERLVA
ncbi:hypothetical protein NKJ90_28935 [Mesorhizobium sp. M0051]|uniref:hypothetical protein n=1 Tax=Mesorhizobium sp. M0051 TaxID=2956862 RepID=UPI003334DE39